jgi:glutaminase
MDLQEIIETIYHKLKKRKGGKNADYIPELKKVNPNLYAISICTVDGKMYNVGDYNEQTAIESVSKVFTLALALKKVDLKGISQLIGNQKTSDVFNSICDVERHKNHTINSFENGGAIATTSILYEKNETKFAQRIFDNMDKFAGRQLKYSKPIYKSEIENADHNRAIAYLLQSYHRFYGNVETTLDVYTKQCSALVSAKDIALMAATLANNGVNPKTGQKAVDKKFIPYILQHMTDNGLYEYSPMWHKKVGFPAKSGVGGFLLIVIPGIMGIGILSPPLDKHGNSVKGILTAVELSKMLRFM